MLQIYCKMLHRRTRQPFDFQNMVLQSAWNIARCATNGVNARAILINDWHVRGDLLPAGFERGAPAAISSSVSNSMGEI